MIEEPEISLHPRQQITVLELLSEAIRQNNQQIVISSHSHFILLGLGIIVQKGLIKTDDIAVYEITKDNKGTKKQIVNLSENGFLMGWHSSFDKIEKKIAAEWFESFEK